MVKEGTVFPVANVNLLAAPISYSFGIENWDKVRMIINQLFNNKYSWTRTKMCMDNNSTLFRIFERILSNDPRAVFLKCKHAHKRSFNEEFEDRRLLYESICQGKGGKDLDQLISNAVWEELGGALKEQKRWHQEELGRYPYMQGAGEVFPTARKAGLTRRTPNPAWWGLEFGVQF